MKLVAIPPERYSDYRYEAIFGAYKWDPQVEDHNTVSPYALVISRETARQLETWAEQLAAETARMEQALLGRLSLAKTLGLPRRVERVLPALTGYEPGRHVRLMRFDFHPTADGWAVSEVNSDVPGGLAEASVLPRIAMRYVRGCEQRGHLGESLLKAFASRMQGDGAVAFVHATAYADDRQVMQYLSDCFERGGLRTLFAAPDHIRWSGREATSILEGQKGALGGVVRFFPLEWLENLPRGSNWQGFYHCDTPSCNHPIAIFAQSKRLPLIWDRLEVDIPAWKALLPITVDPREADRRDEGWIYKPALGRVGEGISIREAVSAKELQKIRRAARWHPRNWVAQRRFASWALPAPDGTPYHLCIGVFAVDGKSAGFYGRISPHPRIDAKAKDIPLLVAAGGKSDER